MPLDNYVEQIAAALPGTQVPHQQAQNPQFASRGGAALNLVQSLLDRGMSMPEIMGVIGQLGQQNVPQEALPYVTQDLKARPFSPKSLMGEDYAFKAIPQASNQMSVRDKINASLPPPAPLPQQAYVVGSRG